MEVNLIGFGAIGGVFAKELSEKGIKINAYEEDLKIGYPVHCSGLISNSTLKEIGIRGIIIKKFNKAYFHSHFQDFSIFSKKGMVLIDRAKLEEKLAKSAEKNDVQIFLGKRMDSEEIKKLNGIVVGSDGINSETAKAFGLPQIKKFVITYKKFFYIRKRIDGVHLFFDVSDFFGWVIPHSNFAEIGVASFSNPKQSFQKLLNKKFIKDIIKKEKINKLHKNSSLIPMEVRKKTYSKRCILIGDAAGHIKFISGGGLAFGVRIAKIGANAVYNNLKYGKPLSFYEKEWKKKYMLDFQIHSFIRKILSSRFKEIAISFARMFSFAFKELDPDAPWRMGP
ncbi:MAG: hypothetical protein ACP5HJ_00405 [Candidatus Micrarchaeia archaeon]